MSETSTDSTDSVKCPNGCRGRLQWVDDQWYCPVCEDEWGDEVTADGR